jgi:DNA helicase-2/ATP-dependent DNA helicase PcrA
MEYVPRPSQAEILAYTSGRLGVSAVPGAGKTRTLSALAAGLVRSGGLGPEQEVLIVTLVNSAVDNFEGRIREFLGLDIPLGYRVRTLHGLAHDIVREKPAAVGLEERFGIVDEREAEFIRREAARAWLQAHPTELDAYLDPELDESRRDYVRRQQLPDLVHDLSLAFIRTAKDNRLTPEQLRGLLDQAPAPLPLAELGWEVYAAYQRALTYRGAVDFDDLIRLALDLLESDSDFLERLRYRWPYVLEDEAQDSSELQEQILRLLAGKTGGPSTSSGRGWVRVGDPNQAIFETFTTASPRHLLDFVRKEADQYRELPDSGRCQPAIIALANELVRWVIEEHPEAEARSALTVPYIRPAPEGDLQPNPPEDPSGVRLVGRKHTPEAEVEAVVKSLEKWLPDHADWTVAALVPRNTRGVELIEALKRRKLEYVEFLASTSSTRAAAGRLEDAVSALADPGSALKLARAYQAWRRGEAPEDGGRPQVADEAGSQEESPGASLPQVRRQVGELLRKCREVETFAAPVPGKDWLEAIAPRIRSGSPGPEQGTTEGLETPSEARQGQGSQTEPAVLEELTQFRRVLRRWQGATALPVDQMVLTISLDLFTAPNDLALAHKLAQVLRRLADEHADWRLPELTAELGVIARNERRFIGFSDDDAGFDPDRHRGKVVVTTMHKAKGLEWDRVYLMSVNNYDFPSGGPNDSFIAEKWFLRPVPGGSTGRLNLEAEALAQLEAARSRREYEWYAEGQATQTARLDYVRERLRLLYVGITRAKKELVITWNTGRQGEQTQAIPFAALQGWWERSDRAAGSMSLGGATGASGDADS